MAVNLVLPVNVASNGLVSTTAAVPAEGLPFDFAALLDSQLTDTGASADGAAALLTDTVRQVKEARSKSDPHGEAKGLQGDLPASEILAALAAGQMPPQAVTQGDDRPTVTADDDSTVNVENEDKTTDQAALLAALGLPLQQPPQLHAGSHAESAASDGSPPGLSIRDLAHAQSAGDPQTRDGHGLAIGAELQSANEASNGAANLAADRPTPSKDFAETLNSLQNSAPATASPTATATNTAAATHAAEVRAHVSDVQWKHEFGDHIVWMAKNDTHNAQLTINPPQLGPVQISLNLNGDQASATFASPHQEVRQAIEDALPRLREMLASNGISLGDANVGAQLPQQRETAQQFAGESRSRSETAILTGDAQPAASGGTMALQRGRGLVDLFA